MTNYLIAEAERISDENAEYSEWVMENQKELIVMYVEQLDKFPILYIKNASSLYIEEAIKEYVSNLTIDDVPNDFISNIYNNGGL